MLSRADLEAIRLIVREELQRVGLHEAAPHRAPLTNPSPREAESPMDVALQESAAAFYRACVADTRAAWDEADRADAVYRLGWDEGYQKRARRTLRIPDDVSISVDDMVKAIQSWRRRPRGKTR